MVALSAGACTYLTDQWITPHVTIDAVVHPACIGCIGSCSSCTSTWRKRSLV
jgi:hypothetical protein